MLTTTRRPRALLLALISSLLLLGACGSDDDSSSATARGGSSSNGGSGEDITVRFATVQGITTNLPLIVAEQQGFLQEEGLVIDYINVANAPAIDAALAGGSADMGVNSGPRVAASADQGLDLFFIAALNPENDFRVMVPPGSDVPITGEGGATWEDTVEGLEGKNIGTNGRGATPDVYLSQFFEELGMSGQDYIPVNAGTGPNEIAALTGGQVDASVSAGAAAATMLATGDAVVALDMSVDGPDYITNLANRGFVANGSFLEEHPDFAERFQRALAQGIEYIQDEANADEVVTIAVEEGMLPDGEHTAEVLASLVAGMGPTFEPEQFDAVIDYLKRVGELEEDSDLAPEDFALPQAAGEG